MKQYRWKIIDQICVKNGFSLKEVREIRKNLREVLPKNNPPGPDKHNYNLPLDSAFLWMDTPQGHDYWKGIAKRLRIPGYL